MVLQVLEEGSQSTGSGARQKDKVQHGQTQEVPDPVNHARGRDMPRLL